MFISADTTENFTAYEYEGKGAIVARQDDALPSSSKAHYVHMDSFQKQKTPCAGKQTSTVLCTS